ncbi:MAG: hypothetical protein RI962_667, partial [Pseudomonadota bacterium]
MKSAIHIAISLAALTVSISSLASDVKA